MSGKLDKSLDDIVKTRRQTARRTTRRPGARTTRTTTATPVGGVTKPTKSSKPTVKSTNPVVPAAGVGESKIIVSGLPSDVTEQQIKDYFAKTIGPVKRVFLTYGPSGQSRGISTIVFNKAGSAVEAASQLNGVKVDNRAMKIEVIVGADQAPAPTPAKALGERIHPTKSTTNPKNQPKSAVTAASAGSRTARKPKRGRNTGRGKVKTAEELDAEMVDYFDATGAPVSGAAAGAAAAAANGAAQPAAGATADAGMEDEIM